MLEPEEGKMPNATQDVAAQDATTPASADDDAYDKARAMATIAKLREAEKEGRAAKARLAALEAEARAADEAKLMAEKKFEELADRWKKEAESAKQELERERLAAMRLKIGMTKGISPLLAERLVGTTQEELEADAEAILALLPKSEADAAVVARPQAPDLNATGVPTAKNPKTLIAKLTPQEIVVAQKMGLTPEEYAKWKES
jgi:hypothetical protein